MLEGWNDNTLEQLSAFGITNLYHVTDKDNIASILKERGLASWSQIKENGFSCPRSGGDAISQRLDKRLQRENTVHLYAFDPSPSIVPSMMATGRFSELSVLTIDLKALRPHNTTFWLDNPYSGGERIENMRDLLSMLEKDPSIISRLSVDIEGTIHINHIGNIPEDIWSRISEVHPTAIVFVVDQSCSMAKSTILNNVEYDYISDLVAEAINTQIDCFLKKCIADDGTISHLYDIAVIGYGNDVSPAWNGDLADKPFHSPMELLSHVKGPGDKFRWVDPKDEDTRGRYDKAFEYVHQLLLEWTAKEDNRFSYPPTVIHISDGDVKLDYEEAFLLNAEKIKALNTENGNVILWNLCYLPRRFREYLFLSGEELLALTESPASLILYEASSYLPNRFKDKAAVFHKKNKSLERKTMGINVLIETLFDVLRMCVLPE